MLEKFSPYQTNNDFIFKDSASKKDESDGDINIVAHRGYSSAAPENTLPALTAAAQNGFDTVECDIEWTKDEVPVLLHDSSINRTARKQDGSKFLFNFIKRDCSDFTYEELLEYDFGIWKGEEFKGTKIPTFDEMLEYSKEYGVDLYIELKKNSGFDNEKAQDLLDAVEEAGLEENVTWISFEEDYLKTISELDDDARLGYLYKKTPCEDTIETLEDLKTKNNEVFLDVKYSKLTPESVELLNKNGFSFEAWTVDDYEILDKLYEYGCKGITTNALNAKEVDKYLKSEK